MKNQVKKIHSNQAYQLYYHGMMLPGFIFLILFNFVPMFGVIMAFQDYRPAKGFFGSDFVGLKHFKYLFEMPDSFELFRNPDHRPGQNRLYHHHVHRLCDSAQ